MCRTPSSTERVLEIIHRFLRIAYCGNELFRIEFHDLCDRMQAVFGFRKQPSAYLKEGIKILGMFGQRGFKSGSTTRDVVE